MRKLDIGSGYRIPEGYEHMDIRPLDHIEYICDGTKKLHFRSETFDEVRSSHMIEHIEEKRILEVLKEWRRILKRGGIIRIICPDLKKQAQIITKSKDVNVIYSFTKGIFGGQNNSYDFHYFGFTIETLAHFLSLAGFKNIVNETKPLQMGIGEIEVTAKK